MPMYKQCCICVLPVAISCDPAPDAPANGERIVSGRTFESTVTYTCEPGYTLHGDNTRTCMANKRWSGSAPICNRKLFAIRCSTIDVHMGIRVHQGNVLQHEDSGKNFSSQKQIVINQQVKNNIHTSR